MTEQITEAERRRLDSLARHGLLDERPGRGLRRIVRDAAESLDAAYAGISFVDNAYERFAVTHGGHFIPIPRRESFGDHVIRRRTVLVVENALRDRVYSRMMLVREPPGVHFYAGAPLLDPDGNAVGVLAVMDSSPREANENQLRQLRRLARRAEVEILQQGPDMDRWRAIGSEGDSLRQVFSALPEPMVLLEPERFRVVQVTDAFLDLSRRRRQDIVGYSVFDVFPEDPDDPETKQNVANLRMSLERVRRTGIADQLPVQRYPVREDGEGGKFTERYWSASNSPVFGDDNSLQWIVHATRDITDYVVTKQREDTTDERYRSLQDRADEMEISVLKNAAEQKRLNDRLRMAHRVANVASWEINVQDNTSTWSEELYRLLGLPPKSVIENVETFMDFIHPEDRDLFRRMRRQAVRGNVPHSLDHRMMRADGEIRHVQERAELVRDADGKPLLLYGTIQDITEQKRIEHALAERARQQAVIARLGQEALESGSLQQLWDAATKAIAETFDVEYCKVLQLTPERDGVKLVSGVGWKEGLVGKAVVGIGRESQAGYTLLSSEPVVVEDLRTETRFNGPPLLHDHGVISGISTIIPGEDGPWGVLGAHSRRKREFSDDDVNFFQSIANMIAEANHRAADSERVRESEERFRIVAKATADIVWDWNLLTDRVWWNEGMQSIFGYAPEDLEPDSRSFELRIHPEDRAAALRHIRSVIENNEDSWQAEYRFLRKDGSVADVIVRGFLVRDSENRPVRMVGAMDDITLRKEYETRLKQQAALLDKAQDAIIVTDMDHRVTYWNRSAERLYGWTAEEATGQPVQELLREDREQFVEASRKLLENGEWMGEFAHFSKDGTRIISEVAWSLVTDENGDPQSVLAINTDITERLALEEQLRQSQRLESVGQLTGGVAHDFNNLLTVILGNAELMLDQLPPTERLHKLAEMTRTAAQRGAELTHRLLAFARRQALEPASFDVNALIRDTEPLLRRALPETIDLEFVPGEDTWDAFADPSQLESVVLNLALNAKDAMPDGGRLTIETANVRLDEEYAAHNAEVGAGRYVMIAVSDTGIGIPPENLDRVFDPFFTTKEKGKGTGLGLSMAYGFAKQSQGHIKIYSEPGQGTTVKLYLPRSTRPGETKDNGGSDEIELRGSERILVVEDNDLVREHAERQLEAFGYEVLSARNGPDALEILKTDTDIDLLFTDVIMSGGMSGRELAEAAHRHRPDLRVLYTSGYTENAIVHHGRLDEGVHLLQKPYRRAELAQKVRRALTDSENESRPGVS